MHTWLHIYPWLNQSSKLRFVGVEWGWGRSHPPVQYIQHTSPVHTTHQPCTYHTPNQYIQHTSPTHQSSTYTCNTPAQYIQHTAQYIQHIRPVHTTHQSNTPVQYIQHTSPEHTTHQSLHASHACVACACV